MVDCTDEVEVLHHPGHKGSSTTEAQNGVNVIDLASPGGKQGVRACDLIPGLLPRGPPCRRDHLSLDNNMAQPSQLDSQPSVELLDEQDAVHTRERHKRLWGEMAGEQHSMQWGSTGCRSQRRATPMLAHSNAVPGEAAGSPQPMYATPAAAVRQQPALRRRVIRPRSAQQQATAKTAAAPVVVIDDSPAPERSSSAGPPANQERRSQRVDSFQAALAAATAGPQGRSTRHGTAVTVPTSIQSNPRLGGQQFARRSSGPAAAAAAVGASAAGNRLSSGRRRSSDSSDVLASSGSGRSSSSDAEMARKQQEEEDARLARRLMEEEQQEAQRQAALRYRMRAEMYRMQEEAERAAAHAAAAISAATASNRNRRGGRAPTRALQQEDIPPGQAQQQPQRREQWGMAMAQALLQLPRWGMASASTGGRSVPASLLAMRDAVVGMQRAGLPAHMLFSDRDFTADDYEALCRLDETVENRKGASSNTIAALPTQTVPAGGILGSSGEKLSCAVCLEEFAEGAELRSLPCLHKFHKDCIDRWLGQKACCPVCNQECK